MCASVPPEVEAAVKFALREVAAERPEDPVRFVAEKLREFSAAIPPQVANYGSGDRYRGCQLTLHAPRWLAQPSRASHISKGQEEPEPAPRKRSRARNRRSVVFAPPVKMDESWEPTIIPKSDEEKAAIREVGVRTVLCGNAGVLVRHVASG